MQVERLLLPQQRWAQCNVWQEHPSCVMNSIQYHIIIIPGNPGVADFYTCFAEKLWHKLGGRMSIRAFNLGGFLAQEHQQVQEVQTQCNHAHAAAAPASTTTPSSASSSSSSSSAHTHTHRILTSKPVTYTLKQQCAFMHEFLRALNLQLLCADELGRGVQQPPELTNNRLDLHELLSPYIRSGSSILNRREHRFILMGHSIGSHLAVQAMHSSDAEKTLYFTSMNNVQQQPQPNINLLLPYLSSNDASAFILPPVNIEHSFLLFPFIRMDLSKFEYFTLHSCLRMRPFFVFLTYCFKLLPISWFNRLLKLVMGIHADHAVKAVYDTYTNPHIVNNSLYFALTEFHDIPRAAVPPTAVQVGKFDPINFLGKYVPRLTCYYAAGKRDHWGPIEQMHDLQAIFPALRCFSESQVVHAFCAFDEQNEIMASHIEKELNTLMNIWNQQQQQQQDQQMNNGDIGYPQTLPSSSSVSSSSVPRSVPELSSKL